MVGAIARTASILATFIDIEVVGIEASFMASKAADTWRDKAFSGHNSNWSQFEQVTWLRSFLAQSPLQFLSPRLKISMMLTPEVGIKSSTFCS